MESNDLESTVSAVTSPEWDGTSHKSRSSPLASSPEMTLVSPKPESYPITPINTALALSLPINETPKVIESSSDIFYSAILESRQAEPADCGMNNREKTPMSGATVVKYTAVSNDDRDTNVDRIGVPDGGLRAWLVVLGGFLDFTVAFGLLNSFGTFQTWYQDHWTNQSISQMTWIGSIQLFVVFIGGVFVGPAFDKFGARRLMIPGTLICLMSFIATSFAKTYVHYLLAQGFLFGIGNALVFYPVTGSISEWFDENRGLALGIAISGASVGGVIWPILVTKLFETVDEPWVQRILAAICIPLLLASCFLVKERKEVSGHDTKGNQSNQAERTYRKAILEWKYMTLCLSLLFVYGGMLVPFYYIPLYAEQKVNVEPIMANNLLAITYAGSVIGRVGAGWLADRLGRFNVLFLVASLTSVITFCWIQMSSFATASVCSVFFGLFSGGLMPLGSACVAQTTPDMGHIGLRIGAMMAFSSIGALSGGPISGVIKDTSGDWKGTFIFSASTTLLGALLLLVVRFIWQPRWNTKV